MSILGKVAEKMQFGNPMGDSFSQAGDQRNVDEVRAMIEADKVRKSMLAEELAKQKMMQEIVSANQNGGRVSPEAASMYSNSLADVLMSKGQLMMEDLGLAASMQQQVQSAPMRNVQEVVMMLKQGMSPEELVQKGIPMELVRQAMEMLNAEAGEVQEPGLAGMYMKGNM